MIRTLFLPQVYLQVVPHLHLAMACIFADWLRDPRGRSHCLGGCFWAEHTAFLPITACFMSFPCLSTPTKLYPLKSHTLVVSSGTLFAFCLSLHGLPGMTFWSRALSMGQILFHMSLCLIILNIFPYSVLSTWCLPFYPGVLTPYPLAALHHSGTSCCLSSSPIPPPPDRGCHLSYTLCLV